MKQPTSGSGAVDSLRQFAQDWVDASRRDNMGMGSATPGSARAVDEARKRFTAIVDATFDAGPREIARAILYEPEVWAIWSFEHNGWWRPNKAGYSKLAEEAGLYSATEVCQIFASSDPREKPKVPVFYSHVSNTEYPGTLAH